ncbi:MAG: 16S rRNA (cytosine(967)-C(5))-methyltransferase RsmB [Bradyrhizobiaceae bacterium]|nr:16S rRNA (cytosine(967)-C(5))-methyltransferase RsmB [Bradyrhizobiaceae bacterium]
MTKRAKRTPAETPGLASRRLAAEALFAVLHRRRPLDEVLDPATGLDGLRELADRDRALVRMLTATVLRRLGTLRALIAGFTEKGLPPDVPQVEIALLLGAAQILFLDVPDHAAVDLSVQLAAARRNKRYAGLANAVLRRIAREGRARHAALDPLLDTPPWLLERWQNHYGTETAAAIAAAHRLEPPLDLTAKRDAAHWAERLGGLLLPNGTIRLASAGPIAALPGYNEGAWWVQDVAASLPARLLGDVRDRAVADLCAAPGGKTAQLAAAGARVTAVDRSENRLKRLRENLARLGLSAEVVAADAAAWKGGPFDAVLLDAPCSATGTIRRHPDIPWQKAPDDLAALTALQSRLLDNAAMLTKPGGVLVYATCSLEPEEGEQQVESFLAREQGFVREPVEPAELGGLAGLISPAGDLRSLPCHLPHADIRFAGCDGFFATRLRRMA